MRQPLHLSLGLLAAGTALVATCGCGVGDEIYDFDGDGSPDSTDCAPTDASIFPASPDEAGDDLDANCDGTDGMDADGDGHASVASGGTDCNDDNPEIYPGAEEIPDDSLDNDCEGGDATCDSDGDGVQSPSCPGGTDCDDANSLVYPGADELCDGLDTNCDESIPANEVDADKDGVRGCAGDCRDDDALVSPLLDEACDGLDTNCDGTLPEDESDADDDGVLPCAGDCDDADATRYPGADEGCDGIDTDCDESLGTGEADVDGDGDPACSDCDDGDATADTLNADGDALSSCEGDCNDLDPSIYPGAADYWGDAVDANCDEIDGLDADGDTFAANADPGDCDDDPLSAAATATYPGAVDTVGDSIDQDCDGIDGIDEDGDGVASESSGGLDCNDDPLAFGFASYPGAADVVADGVDTNCDGIPGTDDDGDGVASVASGGGDCDDDLDSADALTTYPLAADTVGDSTDQNCDGVDGVDEDGDGVASEASGGTDCNDAATDVLAAVTFPGASDAWGDGEDTDCDGMDGIDQDGDEWAVNAGGPDQDCDDTDPQVYPDSDEVWESPSVGLDTNCDGDLYTLLANFDASFVGEDASDQSGSSVASAGDVDGDGLSDVLIGASGNADVGIYAGKTYLFLGASITDGGTFDLSTADAAFVAENEYDYSGTSVASAGDVDGDGLSDLLIGASGNADGGSYAGKTYLFLGASIAAGGAFNLSAADASFVGESAYIYSGGSVASAGDVDGDGLSDLLIGAHANSDGGPGTGKTHLFLASSIASGGTFNLSAADASFVGENPQDYSGGSVASAGDVDGDGLSDLLIGAYANDDGGPEAGKTYLFLGASITAGGTFNLSAADASFVGENPGDYSGNVASAGDVDGDGLDDLLIGATENDEAGNRAGKTYLVFASSIASGGAFNLSAADAAFVGEAGDDQSGSSVTSAGDVDGDGFSDLLIGAKLNDGGGTDAGKSYVFLGSSIGSGGTFGLSQADAAFAGEHTEDASGYSVSSAGDVDGDGLSDLLVGAMANDDGGSLSGKTYLVLSTYPTPDYAGLWAVAPATTYTCGPGFVSAQLDHLVIDHVAPYAIVAGSPELTMDSSSPQPGLLQGSFVASATPDSFEVTRTESLNDGACTATWSLTGSYTNPDTLSADFTATFSGSCGDCINQTFPVTATR